MTAQPQPGRSRSQSPAGAPWQGDQTQLEASDTNPVKVLGLAAFMPKQSFSTRTHPKHAQLRYTTIRKRLAAQLSTTTRRLHDAATRDIGRTAPARRPTAHPKATRRAPPRCRTRSADACAAHVTTTRRTIPGCRTAHLLPGARNFPAGGTKENGIRAKTRMPFSLLLTMRRRSGRIIDQCW